MERNIILVDHTINNPLNLHKTLCKTISILALVYRDNKTSMTFYKPLYAY